MLIRVSIVSECRNVAVAASAASTAITMYANDFQSSRHRSGNGAAEAPNCSGDVSSVPD
jgi:hypothetical protein